MLEAMKNNVIKFIKALVYHLSRERRFIDDRLTIAYVENVLEKHVNLADINIPSHYLKFCFDLFSKTEIRVEKVKWQEMSDDLSFKRFDRLIQLLEVSMPGYNTTLALELLDTANELSESHDEMPGTGLDVTQHFLISSSFSLKGKLLFNSIRFMRPTTCVEIGTAYGMSAMFTLQALRNLGENGRLWTIEAADIQYAKSSKLLNKNFNSQVTCLHGMSTECLPSVVEEVDAIDFYFHDGGHQYDNIVNNFRQVKPHLRSGSVVLIDDIHWWDKRLTNEDPRCYEAWKLITDDPSVGCAIEVNNSIGIAIIL